MSYIASADFISSELLFLSLLPLPTNKTLGEIRGQFKPEITETSYEAIKILEILYALIVKCRYSISAAWNSNYVSLTQYAVRIRLVIRRVISTETEVMHFTTF